MLNEFIECPFYCYTARKQATFFSLQNHLISSLENRGGREFRSCSKILYVFSLAVGRKPTRLQSKRYHVRKKD